MYLSPSLDDQPTEVREIIALVQSSLPTVQWSRLIVHHPGADDDGIWFFSLPDEPGDVQIESTFGVCPFVVETDKHPDRYTGDTVTLVADTVVNWLRLPGGRPIRKSSRRYRDYRNGSPN